MAKTSQKNAVQGGDEKAGLEVLGEREIVREGSAPNKILIFGDHIDRAFSDALSETIHDPDGNVDDEASWPFWAKEVRKRVSDKLGFKLNFVRVSFHKTDEFTGAPFEDSNWVRIQLSAGGQTRNILMVDPTPED